MAAAIDTSRVDGTGAPVAALKQHMANNGSTTPQQEQQQVTKTPPPIPHITNNFIPLKTIISSMVLYASAELRNVLETLPATSSDLTKKRRLLDYIVKMRVQFVKIYVLMKWVKVSKDISTNIDVVAWLNGQQNCFQNVIEALKFIEKSLGGAKLRNPDLETALEVFTAGRPAHPLHGFVPVQKLSAKTILQTLYDLNILLSIRLALTEKLPPEFSHYQIANGRVTFFVENSYQVQLGIADDSVDARFFLVDFQFDFPGAHVPAPATRAKLETIANGILPTKGLVNLFETLLKFTQNYKLALMYAELVELGKGLYQGLILPKFYPERSLVTVSYWLSAASAAAAKNVTKNQIEIGLRRDKTIGIRWSREGTVVNDHGIEFGQTNISTEWLLQEITTLHVRHNIATIHAILAKYNHVRGANGNAKTARNVRPGSTTTSAPTPSESTSPAGAVTPTANNSLDTFNNTPEMATLVSPEKIKIHLTESRYTIYSIDRLSGRAILTNSTKLIASAEAALNDNYDKPIQVAGLLVKLRHASVQEEIIAKAKSAGWITTTNMPFSNDAVRSQFPPDTRLLFCLRQGTWPARWFLLVTIGSDSQPRWWISQLVIRDGLWHILFSEEVHVKRDNPNHFDYKMFRDLSTFTIRHIQTEALCKELDLNNVKYKLLQSAGDSSGAPVILIDMRTLTQGTWAEETLFLTLVEERADKTVAVLQGKSKQALDIGSMSSDSSRMEVDATTGGFTLNMVLPDSCLASPAYLSGRYRLPNAIKTEGPKKSEFIEHLVNKFSQIERIVSYVNLLKSLSLELKEASMTKITFEYGPGLAAEITLQGSAVAAPNASGVLAASSTHSLSETAVLRLPRESPHHFVEPFLQSMLNSDGLLSVVWVLQTALPLYTALKDVMALAEEKFTAMTAATTTAATTAATAANGTRNNATFPLVVTPHSVFEIQLFFPHKRVRVLLRLMEVNGRPLSVFVTEVFQAGQAPHLSGPAPTSLPPAAQQALQQQQQAHKTSLLAPLWTQRSDIPGVVPLVQGLACPIASIDRVLRRIFDILV